MDIKRTRAIRAELRTCLPAFASGIVDDDSLSAVLATLSELLVFRVLNSKGQTSTAESVELLQEASAAVSDAMERFLLKHVPESKILRLFRKPGDVPPAAASESKGGDR